MKVQVKNFMTGKPHSILILNSFIHCFFSIFSHILSLILCFIIVSIFFWCIILSNVCSDIFSILFFFTFSIEIHKKFEHATGTCRLFLIWLH